MTKKLFILAALTTMCLGSTACDDVLECTPGCDATTNQRITCTDGIEKRVTCETGTVCSVVDNAPVCNAPCTEADNKCENGTAYVCTAGVLASQVCGATETCQIVDGTPKCQEQTSDTCTTGDMACKTEGIAMVCINGVFHETPCGDKKACIDGSCKDICVPKCDNNTKITCDATGKEDSEPCGNDYECKMVSDVPTCELKPVFTDGGVGDPCTCNGDNCQTTITAAELVNMIPADMVPADVAPLLTFFFPEGDDTTAPNFFAGDSVKGCEKVVVPNGMTLGCLYDSTVNFSSGLSTIAGVIAGIEPSETIPAALIEAMKVLNENIFKPGIEFKAPKGYCTVGAMNVSGEMEGMDMDVFFGKLNTGDYAAAKAAECPAGSVKLDYGKTEDTDTDTEATANIDGGFIMCAKSCNENTDCRTEDGYSCEAMPVGLPSADVTFEELPTVKVCLDKANIDMMASMLEAFAPLLESLKNETENGTENGTEE